MLPFEVNLLAHLLSLESPGRGGDDAPPRPAEQLYQFALGHTDGRLAARSAGEPSHDPSHLQKHHISIQQQHNRYRPSFSKLTPDSMYGTRWRRWRRRRRRRRECSEGWAVLSQDSGVVRASWGRTGGKFRSSKSVHCSSGLAVVWRSRRREDGTTRRQVVTEQLCCPSSRSKWRHGQTEC